MNQHQPAVESRSVRLSPGRWLRTIALVITLTTWPWFGIQVIGNLAAFGVAGTLPGIGTLVSGLAIIALNFRAAMVNRRDRWPRAYALGLVVAWWFAVLLYTSIQWHLRIDWAERIVVLLVASLPPLAVVWHREWLSTWRQGLACGIVGLLAVGLFPYRLQSVGIAGDARPTWERRHRDHFIRVADSRAALPIAEPHPDIAQLRSIPTGDTFDYPQFLGRDRAGRASLPDAASLSRSTPQLRWQRSVGAGWGSIAVAADLCVSQELDGDSERIVAIDRWTGQERWNYRHASAFTASPGGPGPRATPTIDAARGVVYAVTGNGHLLSLRLSDGRLVWQFRLHEPSDILIHGTCGSPLLWRDIVIAAPTSASGPCLVALDAMTGEKRWQAGSTRSSYSSPHYAELCGIEQVLLYHEAGLSGFDLESGRELWHFPWRNSATTHASQPCLVGPQSNRVLVTTGYDLGGVMLELTPHSPAWQVTDCWHSRQLKTKFSSAIWHEGIIFALDNGILVAVDEVNGTLCWKGGRYGFGQLLLAGDELLVQAESGDLAVVETSRERWNELAHWPALDGKTWNHPALAWPLLYVRNDRTMAAYEMKPSDR